MPGHVLQEMEPINARSTTVSMREVKKRWPSNFDHIDEFNKAEVSIHNEMSIVKRVLNTSRTMQVESLALSSKSRMLEECTDLDSSFCQCVLTDTDRIKHCKTYLYRVNCKTTCNVGYECNTTPPPPTYVPTKQILEECNDLDPSFCQ